MSSALKSVETLTALHHAQMVTCMKVSRAEVGLLINFIVMALICAARSRAGSAPHEGFIAIPHFGFRPDAAASTAHAGCCAANPFHPDTCR